MNHPGRADRLVKDAPMKTLGEFLQRLEDDPAFEDKAQAFIDGDELMAFVRSEGYDFTLEQLTDAFKQKANLPPEADVRAPAPPEVSAASPPGAEATTLPKNPATLPGGESGEASPISGSADFPREPSGLELPELPRAIPPKSLAEKSGALFKGGGGRHRGFSPERIKNVAGEDS
jgi:predicted ribosomally synthesized peptide with nif11-like leader